MTRIQTICLCALCLLLTGCFSFKSHMAEYTPVERTIDRNKIILTPKPEWKTPEHLSRIQDVFKTYDIKFKIKDGKLLIDEDLASDWQTISAYSMKANDPDWNKKSIKPQNKPNMVRPTPQLNSGWSIQSGSGR